MGALRQPDGSVEWTLWAPLTKQVTLVVWREAERQSQVMTGCEGYHRARLTNLPDGTRYAYQVDGQQYPDPASRSQPDGVHEPSAVYSPERFEWHDAEWQGVPRDELVIYELHVGTFTPQGTFDAVIPRLPALKELGVTAIEIMPVGQFPGGRNWGYDGVLPYAAQNTYGGPAGLQRLVDAAHQAGLAVLLDVVYNHFGPEGNYLSKFGPYFTHAYHTPWGDAVNFDGPDSDPVRQYVIDNACMWVRDFHCDGLRLDAVHAIYDFGARPLLAEISAAVQAIAKEQTRPVHVIAESDQNDPRLIDPPEKYGFGLTGVWADEFHHCVRALLAGDNQGYFQAFGSIDDLAQAYERVFVYDGRYSSVRKRRHGAPIGVRDRSQLVVCIHNHDQIGNRALGDRSATYLSENIQRLACGLLLISPCTPMLFMGEEYGERNPFPFFCSFGDDNLIAAVRKGRREEFASLGFAWGEELPDPQAEATFESAKLSWAWPSGEFSGRLRKLYRDLLTARKKWRPLKDRQHTTARPLPGDALLLVERGTGDSLVAIANLSEQAQPFPEVQLGNRQLLLSTEAADYGGARTSQNERPAELLPYELMLWGKREQRT
ncbi:malto-oligosyltrehalose trehalohydrolase [Planctomicrobium piriforme]|uniref:malto-oligosyltrehalose trehalohydrolase n=1 Tax=Planctomicrobium piriforme TaxID=1576369 RepID=UPI001587D839|nr:malto-oligosyltrehalose trehalohydrolase [Planctomicrobium piriforme]